MPVGDAREREYTSVGESGQRAPNCGRARRRTRRTEQNALRAIERSCSVPRQLLLAETVCLAYEGMTVALDAGGVRISSLITS